MTSKILSTSIVVIFLFVAVFGLYLMLLHPMHHGGCPLMVAEKAICSSSVIEHVSLWQTMFASILTSFILLLAFVFFEVGNGAGLLLAHEQVRYRIRTYTPRPTLFQELFSRGIHNRKEPYHF